MCIELVSPPAQITWGRGVNRRQTHGLHGYVYFPDVPRSRDDLACVSLNQAGILLSCVHTGLRELGVKVGIKEVGRGQGASEEGETNKTDWLATVQFGILKKERRLILHGSVHPG